MKKANIKFYLDNLVYLENISVLIFSDLFDSAHSFTVADWQSLYSAEPRSEVIQIWLNL